MVFQSDASSFDSHLVKILWIVAIALVSQALVMIGMAIGAARAQKDIKGQIEEIKGKLLPILDKSNVLIADLTPQVRQIAGRATVISGHVDQISALVKDKLVELSPTISAANETLKMANETVRQANEKTAQQVEHVSGLVNTQVDRVNGMVSSVLDVTAQAGLAIQRAVMVPVREAAGIVDGLRTAWITFLFANRTPKEPVYRAPSGTYGATDEPEI
jgi:methyl-accepting chemotaxis protein